MWQVTLFGQVANPTQYLDRSLNRVPTKNLYRPLLGFQQTQQMLDKRRFPRTVGTNQTVRKTWLDLQTDAIQRHHFPKSAGKIFNTDNILTND